MNIKVIHAYTDEEKKEIRKQRRVEYSLFAAVAVVSASITGCLLKTMSDTYKTYDDQDKKDSAVMATLTERRNMSDPNSGILFFDTVDGTNRGRAVAWFQFRGTNRVVQIKELPLGTQKKVSEWKRLVLPEGRENPYFAPWRELER